MNNSFPRLIDGITTFLNDEIIPELEGDFLRGQLYGAIYILKQMRERGDWSVNFVEEELALANRLFKEVQAICAESSLDSPDTSLIELNKLETASNLIEVRDDANLRIEHLIDWVHDSKTSMPEGAYQKLDQALKDYMLQEVRTEMRYTAKSMFAEISQNTES